jgi:hypothetical protein
VAELGLTPAPGDTVEIVGAAHPGGKAEIIAREFTWNGVTYHFRSDEGVPVWTGAERAQFGRYAGTWNGAKDQEVTGEVEGVEAVSPGNHDMGLGVVARLRTGDQAQGRKLVHLGPWWFVEQTLPGLRVGQRLTVKGTPAQWGGEEVVLASEAQRNQEKAHIRGEQGKPAWAGGWRNWDGWGPESKYGRMYDPTRMYTVQGLVEKVETGAPMNDMGQGLMTSIRTRQQQRMRVHIGPTWFVQQSDISLNPGDSVTLTGSLAEMNGRPVLMVSELSAAGRRIRIREQDGTPVWAGRGASAPKPAQAQSK